MTRQLDPTPGAYYVSVIRDGGDYRLLLGPFMDDHAGALAMVDRVTHKANEIDPRSYWYAFGTCKVKEGPITDGILNKYFPDALKPKESPHE